jgi:NAD(P)-dependent dehydrogenase (short-subunit alcohol dehydrogenase family)
MELDEAGAIVTGGASGIGAATAVLLADRGADVVVLDPARQSGMQSGRSHRHLRCDISSDQEIDAALATIDGELGRIDILVNNAGIGAQGDVVANDRAEWFHVLDVNVVSMARVAALAMPLLLRSSAPAVVNVSSVVALVGVRNRALYGASKGAVVGLTLAMAADNIASGVRVNAVAPGTADTPWIARLLDAADDPEAEAAALRARQPMGRLVTAEEVAHAICYLASPASASTTGTILSVDGGMATLRV